MGLEVGEGGGDQWVSAGFCRESIAKRLCR